MFSKQVKERSAALMFKIGVALLVIVFVVVLGPGLLNLESSQALAKKKKGGRLCTETATWAYKACLNEIQDDYNIAYGKCINVSDSEEREGCFNEAKADYRDAKGECKDQLEARRDVCQDLGEERYDPDLDPNNFTEEIKNSYFPLPSTSGSTFTYYSYNTSTDDPSVPLYTILQTVVVKVEGNTTINGFPCRVVTDKVYYGDLTAPGDHNLLEDTIDWYSQEIDSGNVWYFGESTIAYTYDEEGNPTPDNEGSWKAGEDGAKPGIIMFAVPEDQFYRQEFDLGAAEDIGEVIGIVDNLNALLPSGVSLPAGVVGPYLHTQDSTPMEPDITEDKYYASGVGLVLTVEPEATEVLDSITP
jgi:hypothetical protein